MASTYGYITVANLEAYTGLDYGVIDAKYTDAIVEAQITQSERFVNTQLNGTTPTATDGVVGATLILSERLMKNRLVIDGYAEPELKSLVNFYDDLITRFLKEDSYNPCGPIPTQGIDRQ